jgi:osmoprotectant transport system permease protein
MMGSEPLAEYIAARLPELWLRTGEHLMLTGCSTTAAILIGVPMGILLFRTPWLRTPALGTVGILQTIPSLAMLVFLLALLQKIGVLPALIALSLYALLPIVRNTLTGLDGISPQVVEAARGLGMTESQELRMVRIPLAAPVIVAGIRTAAVVGVGIATLSAFIGPGGLFRPLCWH